MSRYVIHVWSHVNSASIIEAAGKMGLLNGSLLLPVRDSNLWLRSHNVFGVRVRHET
jgi:hypothetical protein